MCPTLTDAKGAHNGRTPACAELTTLELSRVILMAGECPSMRVDVGRRGESACVDEVITSLTSKSPLKQHFVVDTRLYPKCSGIARG